MNSSNDEQIVSPAKKKLKQRSIMESLSVAGMKTVVACESRVSHCAIEIEEDEVLLENKDSLSDAAMVETDSCSQEISVLVKQTEIIVQQKWRGKPLCEIRHLVSENQECPAINHDAAHSISFQKLVTVIYDIKVPHIFESTPVPHPSNYEDRWDNDHVKMPCSVSNLYPVHTEGNSSLRRRWKLIEEAYSKPISSSFELEKAILCYNSRYNQIWDFKQFHLFINKVLSTSESLHFFEKTLPGIVSLAIKMPEKVTRPPVLLLRQRARSTSMSQLQIASLLANAFLCTFPRRNTQKKVSEFSSFPDINFIRLFENKSKCKHVQEKLKCLFHYFDRVSEKEPTGVVTFTRKVIHESDLPVWENVEETLCSFHVSSEGSIEKEGAGLLQMDFANRYIGGGVLGWGCVQEEIRFVICPELIVACLFTEMMEKNEALVITGAEQYCRHSGYSSTFCFEGDFVDSTARDSYGRRLCKIVAVDAVKFRKKEVQYKTNFLSRELSKAYVGFYCPKKDVPLVAVASGNWGCGAYRGDPRLKCLLQLMAASLARRDLLYFTFGDELLRDDVFAMYSVLKEKNMSIGSLYKILCQYGELYGEAESPSLDLYGYLYAVLDTCDSDGDMDCNSQTNDTTISESTF